MAAPSPDRPPIRWNAQRGAFPSLRVIGQRRAPWGDAYHLLLKMPWWGFFALVAGAILGANALFAGLYLLQDGTIANSRPGSFADAFFFSVQTMATIGYGLMAPATTYGHVLVTVEAMTGMIGMALVTGLTFAKFSRATSRVIFSARVVVLPRDGVPHVMFRMANWRHNQIVEAQLRVGVLVRDRTASFFLTWTAMHRIDEQSPFFGPDALDRLRARNAELFLTLIGWDETIGQTIHARYRYGLDDIAWNARFADVLTVDDDGTRVIDYTRFHEVVPLDESALAPAATETAAPETAAPATSATDATAARTGS